VWPLIRSDTYENTACNKRFSLWFRIRRHNRHSSTRARFSRSAQEKPNILWILTNNQRLELIPQPTKLDETWLLTDHQKH